MCKCFDCEHADTCELVDTVNFCKDCKYFDDCDILSTCEGGEYIECNNGFEEKDDTDVYLVDIIKLSQANKEEKCAKYKECESCPYDSSFSNLHWQSRGYFCKIDDFKQGLIDDEDILEYEEKVEEDD